jgi:glucose-6-phosphate isomerase
MGIPVPAEFIGFKKSQTPIHLDTESVSNHDELMTNFFAQADAFAIGKSEEDLLKQGVSPALIPHKVF